MLGPRLSFPQSLGMGVNPSQKGPQNQTKPKQKASNQPTKQKNPRWGRGGGEQDKTKSTILYLYKIEFFYFLFFYFNFYLMAVVSFEPQRSWEACRKSTTTILMRQICLGEWVTCQSSHSLLVTEFQLESWHSSRVLPYIDKIKHLKPFTENLGLESYRHHLKMMQNVLLSFSCLSLSHIIHILYYFTLFPLNSCNPYKMSFLEGLA